jgi:hypothetical protein
VLEAGADEGLVVYDQYPDHAASSVTRLESADAL